MELICLCFQSWEAITDVCLCALPSPSLCTDTLCPCMLGYFIHKVDAWHYDGCTQFNNQEFVVFSILLLWIFSFENLLCIPNLTVGPILQRNNSTFWLLERVFNSGNPWCFLWNTHLNVLPNIISPLLLPLQTPEHSIHSGCTSLLPSPPCFSALMFCSAFFYNS